MESNFKKIEIVGINISQLRQIIRDENDRIINETNAIKKAESLPEYLTQKQVAQFWQVNVKTILNWEKNGILKRHILADSTSFRYHKKDVLSIRK